MAQNKDGADKTVEGQDEKLTGDTNKQEFPSRQYADAGQEDNARRVQTVKELDKERNLLPGQREQLANSKRTQLTSPVGTRVTVGDEATAKALKVLGYK